MKSLKAKRTKLTEKFLARLVKKLSHGESSLLVFDFEHSFPNYINAVYINRFIDRKQFTQELVARLDSPKIGIGDISGNAIYFTMNELEMLNQLISIALSSGKIKLEENTEQVNIKVTQEIQKRSENDNRKAG